MIVGKSGIPNFSFFFPFFITPYYLATLFRLFATHKGNSLLEDSDTTVEDAGNGGKLEGDAGHERGNAEKGQGNPEFAEDL